MSNQLQITCAQQIAATSRSRLTEAVKTALDQMRVEFTSGMEIEDVKALARNWREAIEGHSESVVIFALKRLRLENSRHPYAPRSKDIRDACEDVRLRRHQLGLCDPDQDARDAERKRNHVELMERRRCEQEEERKRFEEERRREFNELSLYPALRHWRETGEWPVWLGKPACGGAPDQPGSMITAENCLAAGIPIPPRLAASQDLATSQALGSA
jgi:hypothetical protein